MRGCGEWAFHRYSLTFLAATISRRQFRALYAMRFRDWAPLGFSSCLFDSHASASVIVSGQYEAFVSG